MAKLSKFKYIIICLLALAVIASATIFSVSYAKWTGGSTQVTAEGSTGVWGLTTGLGAKTDEEITKNIEDAANPNFWNNQYGGVIIDNARGETKATRWHNTNGLDGCSFELDLEVGDTFVIAIFGRVWELNKSINGGQGKCLFANSVTNTPLASADIMLITNAQGRYQIFTVLKKCSITLDIREGDHTGNGGDKDDILTITEATVNYPPQNS